MSFPIDIVRMLFRLLKPRDGCRYGATCKRYYELFIEAVGKSKYANRALKYYCKTGLNFAALRMIANANLRWVSDDVSLAAVKHGCCAVVKGLIARGVQISGWNKLQHALYNGNTPTLKVIWDHYEEFGLALPISYEGMIWYAFESGSYRMLKYILKQMGVGRPVCSERLISEKLINKVDKQCLMCGWGCRIRLEKSNYMVAGGVILRNGAICNVAYHIDTVIIVAVRYSRPRMLKLIYRNAVLNPDRLQFDYKHAVEKGAAECVAVIREVARSRSIKLRS